MTATGRWMWIWACLQVGAPALAGPALAADPKPSPERYARRCLDQPRDRGEHPQGTLLLGTRRSWEARRGDPSQAGVLAWVTGERLLVAAGGARSLRAEGGRLVASPAPASAIIGSVLQGQTSGGKPVEVAICGAEAAPEAPEMMWYRIEAWNPVTRAWENPCAATDAVPDPRALAVAGVWDERGAHHDAPARFTFGCENGVVAKCAVWGYRPWAVTRSGRPLADVHQACTRMARADYCGNGRSHTQESTVIDLYDAFGVVARTTTASADWDPALGTFEAAWAPDGAACLARTRDGRAMATVLQECPGRFRTRPADLDLGDGDRCTVLRAEPPSGPPLLRNRSYPPGAPPSAP